MPVDFQIDLLSFCLNTTYVYDGTYYQQVFGAVNLNLTAKDVFSFNIHHQMINNNCVQMKKITYIRMKIRQDKLYHVDRPLVLLVYRFFLLNLIKYFLLYEVFSHVYLHVLYMYFCDTRIS